MKHRLWGAAFLAAVFGSIALVVGCASPDRPGHCNGGSCDLSTGVGGNGEADMADPPLPQYDLSPTGPMLGFGDSCDNNAQCKSNICIFVGTGGVCTDLCVNATCPAGWGCLGVGGAIDPGTVTYVCVPNSTQLCTPCSHDGECSVGGKDRCLESPVGGHYCGRDCSKIACPNGFSCQDVPVSDMGTFKQCVPTSGACDCDAGKAGMTVTCPITTPFGTCDGTRTCMGAGGWTSSCAPPGPTDSPDDTYKDDNCDGIDGDISKGIFVATAAAAALDDATCGTLAKPCKTINYGINQAAGQALRYVYVQAGVYNENVVMFNGVDIVGGYDAKWQRASRGTAGHNVSIQGGFNSTESQFITVQAHNLTALTTLWDLDVYGANANDGVHWGLASYAIHAYKSKLTLKRVGVFGGNGADGRNGNNGTNAPSLTASSNMFGAAAPPSPPGPGNAHEQSYACNNDGRGRGGDRGTNSCADDDDPSGGGGGVGGTMDTSCSCFLGACVCDNCSATGGWDGNTAATWGLGFGTGGTGGPGGDGSSQGGFNGGSGRVINGAGGGNDSRRSGSVVGVYWYAFGGGTGALGKNGTGG
ncbi:MAG: hypothetical protein JWN44_1168, partial [Myxococcales bacterium]|nr:hypothetical protein [Myxococcales bacterium]